jgi:protein O-GlcNAc transferase
MSQDRLAQLLKRAATEQKAGRLVRAADLCRQILRVDARHSDALHLLGIIKHQSGDVEEAVQLIVKSLQISPNNVSALGNLASVMTELKNFEKALQFYDGALALAPDDAGLHSNRAIILINLNRMEEGVAACQRAIALNPNSWAAPCNMGAALQRLRKFDAAMQCYQRVLAMNPREHHAMANLAALLVEMDRPLEGIAKAEEALRIKPKYETALVALSAAYKALARYDEAIAVCKQVIELNPNSFFACNNMGVSLEESARPAEALPWLERAHELNPGDGMACANLSLVMRDLCRFDKALEHSRKAIALDPGNGAMFRALASVYYTAGLMQDCVDCYRRAVQLKPDAPAIHSDFIYALNYVPHTPRELFAEHVRFGKLYGAPLLAKAPPHRNSADPDRPLRVGYVSGDFKNHPVAHFIEPVFANYSRGQFETYCYASQSKFDHVSERLQGMVDVWQMVKDLKDDELAAQIREDGIDILVDLSGHTTLNRLLVFARKPAPVQVSMIGYMQTTGVPGIDYRVTDAVMDPPGSEAFSSEQLVRLPSGAASFQFHREDVPVNELPALENGYMTFGSFHNIAKIHTGVLDAWAAVMNALPDSRLMLVTTYGDNIVKALHSRGIAKDRIEVIGRRGPAEYLTLHHRVDLVLDTFPFNGYTTNMISAWMGVPALTVRGNNTVSRVGESLLRLLGIPELLADDAADYVRRAVALSSDLPMLAKWRAGLRPRLQEWAGDGSVYIAELENSYREMWRRWCAQQPATNAAQVLAAA